MLVIDNLERGSQVVGGGADELLSLFSSCMYNKSTLKHLNSKEIIIS